MDETSAVLSTNSAFYAAFTAKVSAAPTRLADCGTTENFRTKLNSCSVQSRTLLVRTHHVCNNHYSDEERNTMPKMELLDFRLRLGWIGQGGKGLKCGANLQLWRALTCLRAPHTILLRSPPLFPPAPPPKKKTEQDADRMEALWMPSNDVMCIHPGDEPVLGQQAVARSWRSLFRSGDSRFSSSVIKVLASVASIGTPRLCAHAVWWGSVGRVGVTRGATHEVYFDTHLRALRCSRELPLK